MGGDVFDWRREITEGPEGGGSAGSPRLDVNGAGALPAGAEAQPADGRSVTRRSGLEGREAETSFRGVPSGWLRFSRGLKERRSKRFIKENLRLTSFRPPSASSAGAKPYFRVSFISILRFYNQHLPVALW